MFASALRRKPSFFQPIRQLFVVSLEYVKPLSTVDRYLKEHKAFLDQQYAAGHFVASGRKVPRTGGVILASVANRADLEKILAADPFAKHRLAEYQVTEFLPTMSSEQFKAVAEADAKIAENSPGYAS